MLRPYEVGWVERSDTHHRPLTPPVMGFAIVSSPRVLNKLALQTSHKAASGRKGLFDLVANNVGRARARRCRWSGSPASGRSVAGYVAAFRAAQALADHGSWGAPACVAVGSIIVPTDRLPVDEDVVAGIWSPAATARSAQGRRVRDGPHPRHLWRHVIEMRMRTR